MSSELLELEQLVKNQGVSLVVASFIAELHGVDGERQIKHGVAWDSSLDSLEFCCPLHVKEAERGGSRHHSINA